MVKNTNTKQAGAESAQANPNHETSSNPEILRDRLNELAADLQRLQSAEASRAEQLDRLEAHLGELCKQWDVKLAALAKGGHSRDPFEAIVKPLLTVMKSVSEIRSLTGHAADRQLDALIAEATKA